MRVTQSAETLAYWWH